MVTGFGQWLRYQWAVSPWEVADFLNIHFLTYKVKPRIPTPQALRKNECKGFRICLEQSKFLAEDSYFTQKKKKSITNLKRWGKTDNLWTKTRPLNQENFGENSFYLSRTLYLVLTKKSKILNLAPEILDCRVTFRSISVSCERTQWTAACQAPLSMGFSRQEYWIGLPFPPLGNLPIPRDQTLVSCIASRFFTIWATREAPRRETLYKICVPASAFPDPHPHPSPLTLCMPDSPHLGSF